VLALLDQAQRETRLIDVVVAAFADLGKVLDADGESFALHGLVYGVRLGLAVAANPALFALFE
jgi:hypothetical protein